MEMVSPGENAADETGFGMLADLVYRESGIVLSASKAGMITSRLRMRMNTLKIQDLKKYCSFVLTSGNEAEKQRMISALTTNVSGFLREPHHFEMLQDIARSKLEYVRRTGDPLRIWSAGCSNGQEPYSISMKLLELDSTLSRQEVVILATDIDPEVLEFAERGVYNTSFLNGLAPENIEKFFTTGSLPLSDETNYQVARNVRDLVTFKKLNLVKRWPMKRSFDFIFCRNVVIYFDQETQERLWEKFDQHLKTDGTIFVGHSERLQHKAYKSIGPTSYVRKLDSAKNTDLNMQGTNSNGTT